MKRIRFIVLPILFILGSAYQSQAQLIDAIQQAIIAAIKAADIAVQKAQNATITLQNVQKELENELSSLNLGEIGDWEGKFKDLYSEYYDELKQVKTAIAYYQAITGIIAQQGKLVNEYKQAYALIQKDSHFSASELDYISRVYSGIINESVKSLDQIILVLTSYSLQMTDAARLKLIQSSSGDIEKLTADLRSFNSHTAQMSVQRAKDAADLQAVINLYGL